MASNDKLRLITGHPRSGTHFTGILLRRMGYKASIEGRFMRRGTRFVSSWKHAQTGVDFKYRMWTMRIDGDFDVILHQVRNPLDVIASSVTLFDLTIDHIKRFVDIPEPTQHRQQPISLCMRSWLGWNELIEPKAEWRFQLENLREVFPEFCRRLDIPEQPLPKMGAKNKRKHASLTWDDLYREDEALAEKVRLKAKEYGYETP